jgi:hypothetical protein
MILSICLVISKCTHNPIGSFLWFITCHWTTFKFVRKWLHGSSAFEQILWVTCFQVEGVQKNSQLPLIIIKLLRCPLN